MAEKKIVIISGDMGRGGGERVLSIISNHLAERGCRVYIATLLSNHQKYDLNPDIKLLDFSGHTNSRLLRLPYWIKSIRKLYNEVKPDTVLSFFARINVITLIALGNKSVNTVVSERNDPRYDGRGKLIDFLTKKLYKKATSVVFQTKRTEAYFKDCGLKNTFIIPNPINVTCMAGEKTDRKIVNVGRLIEQKNQKLVIEAVSRLKDKYPDISLHFYGSGRLKETLETLAREKGIADSTVFEGSVQDIHERIADSELFVLSSDYEGLSNALLEAMLMGIPCISTDCGSEEYITDGVNGRICRKNDADMLTVIMDEMLANPEKSRQMGREAQKYTDILNAERVLEKWDALLIREV